MRPIPAETQLQAGPFVLAVVVSLLLVLSAPFVGQVRSAIRSAFPGQFVLIVGGAIGLGVAIALFAAVRRIRERRVARYGAIAAALLIAVAYSAWRAGPFPESNAVERFHFLQYGLITFLFYRSWRPLGDLSIVVLPVLAGIIVGSLEEWFQWFIPNRVGEVGDVFLNLVAVGTGLLFSVGADPPQRMRIGLSAGSRRRTARLTAAALLVFAAFLHLVHFGHEVHDEEIGTFASRYSRAELLELQAERRARWQVTPPPTTVVRLSREDQFLTEGMQHVRWRNSKWDAGDIAAAWLENRILEKYYEPVLDTPTHEGTAGHRWPPEQRDDARVRAAAPPGGTYVSGAYPYRVLFWPRAVFWLVVAVAVALLLLASRRSAGRSRPPRFEHARE